MNVFNLTPSLDKCLEDIEKLKMAYKLLLEIYGEIGPYNSKKISDEMLVKMNNFFKFDDSK